MLSKSITRIAGITMLCGASIAFVGGMTTKVVSAAPAPEAPKLVVSGLFDGYYSYTSESHKQSVVNPGAGAYVLRNGTPTIALAELNLTQAAPTAGGFGYKATFITGDTADINHGVFGGGNNRESRYKNVQQLYGTYLTSAGYGVDFGKFYTPFGYEVTESNANWNYTRSTAFNYLPFYHTGIRVYTPSMKGFVFTGYLFNAFYNSATEGVSSNNKKIKGAGQILFTDPNGKYTFIENVGGGYDQPQGAPELRSFLSDTCFTYTISAADSVGLNYDYTKQYQAAAKRTVNAWAVYYKHQLDPKQAVALRYSGAQDKTDVGGVSTTVKPFDVTATYEMKLSPAWLTRLEYRYDNSNVPSFLDNNGVISKKSQNTIVASEVFTF
ncbi:MAG TPA: outer membrane beta-barrel protein [Capsulimonadaceae bacterium]